MGTPLHTMHASVTVHLHTVTPGSPMTAYIGYNYYQTGIPIGAWRAAAAAPKATRRRRVANVPACRRTRDVVGLLLRRLALARLAAQRARLEDEALAVRAAVDPALATARAAVDAAGAVAATLELRSAVDGAPLAAAARAAAAALPWASSAAVSTVAARPRSFMGLKAPESLARVGALVGVSSCKGGVGKSTVAVNLAYARGAGRPRRPLDADIHGPCCRRSSRCPTARCPWCRTAHPS